MPTHMWSCSLKSRKNVFCVIDQNDKLEELGERILPQKD